MSSGPAAAVSRARCSLGVLRLVLRTQPRSGKVARRATISGDTDRLKICAAAKGRRADWVRAVCFIVNDVEMDFEKFMVENWEQSSLS